MFNSDLVHVSTNVWNNSKDGGSNFGLCHSICNHDFTTRQELKLYKKKLHVASGQ